MCPDHELLSAWMDGEVPSPWAEKIASHLQACASCAAAAKRLGSVGEAIRGDPAGSSIDATVERLRARLEPRFAGAGAGVGPLRFSRRSFAGRRIVTLPLPLAAAAALTMLVLGAAAVVALRPARDAGQALAASETIYPAAQSLSMEELLGYLDSIGGQATLTIRLPSGTTFDNPGRPMIMRASAPPPRAAEDPDFGGAGKAPVP